jgi:hypothetical protein
MQPRHVPEEEKMLTEEQRFEQHRARFQRRQFWAGWQRWKISNWSKMRARDDAPGCACWRPHPRLLGFHVHREFEGQPGHHQQEAGRHSG